MASQLPLDELNGAVSTYIANTLDSNGKPVVVGGNSAVANGTTAPVAPAAQFSPEIEERFRLLRSVGEECQTEEELRNLLVKKPNFVLYDGFEPSGRMHIAQGVFKRINVNKCTRAGGTFKFWVGRFLHCHFAM